MITLISHATAAPKTLTGKCDRALVLMGFIGGCRRSELTSLKVADLRWTEEGLVVRPGDLRQIKNLRAGK